MLYMLIHLGRRRGWGCCNGLGGCRCDRLQVEETKGQNLLQQVEVCGLAAVSLNLRALWRRPLSRASWVHHLSIYSFMTENALRKVVWRASWRLIFRAQNWGSN
jgi:hypothetical protein